jgi:hypothetical protein
MFRLHESTGFMFFDPPTKETLKRVEKSLQLTVSSKTEFRLPTTLDTFTEGEKVRKGKEKY